MANISEIESQVGEISGDSPALQLAYLVAPNFEEI
jgi:hypothetical protein